jgi:hypothetical protein
VIGRFIYIRIPRTIEGRELSLGEVREMRTGVAGILRNSFNLDEEFYTGRSLREVRKILKGKRIPKPEYKRLLSLIKEDLTLSRRIRLLDTMQRLFKYWHVAHLPFALVMLVIMIIHVGVTLVLGYKWIF